MAYQTKDEEYLERLTPLFEKVSILPLRKYRTTEDEPEERMLYNELLNIMNQLQNETDLLNTLTVLEQQDIKDFYNELKSSPNFHDWEWDEWEHTIKQIKQDLEGDFEFNSYGEEDYYDLKGSTLETVRITNRHQNLHITLYNVGGIKISRGKRKISNIEVEITDIHGNTMAEWNEYIKTRTVGLVRLGPRNYQYQYRG